MAVFDLYSKRKKRQESEGAMEIYQYDLIPEELRIQIAHVLREALGRWHPGGTSPWDFPSPSTKIWDFIEKNVAKEHGRWHLGSAMNDPDSRCIEYLMSVETDAALDLIEFSLRGIDRLVRNFTQSEREKASIKMDADEAIDEVNERFREHGAGYQYTAGEIVRVDSQFLHSQVVKPALSLLNDFGFSGPVDEFLRAFDHYREGEKKDAIADSLNAFESTMKSICAARGWTYGPKDTAKPLLDILFKHGLIPPEMESHFSGFRSAIESGVPTLANRTSRHGQGATPVDVPDHFVAYALHMTASNIVFLVECHKNYK